MDKEKELPKRKPTRLRNFDYNTTGAYFITICTEGRRQILSRVVGVDVLCQEQDCKQLCKRIVYTFLCSFKRFCNKEYGENAWQRGFYDHVIRNRDDYEEHVKYVYQNPIRWYYDELYTEE